MTNLDTISNISNSSRADVKSVKFKEPDCYQTTPDSPGKSITTKSSEEQKLMHSLDKAMISTPPSSELVNNETKKVSPMAKAFKSPFGMGGNGGGSIEH